MDCNYTLRRQSKSQPSCAMIRPQGKSLNGTRYQDRDGLQLYFAEIIEVATFVRLENMFQEHLSITALIMWLGRSPRRPSLFKFGFRNQQFQAAALNIQLDGIALLHKCQRSSIG